MQDADNVFGASAPTDVAQMGRAVFRNAAPYIRVRRGEVAALQHEEEFEALDDIRINPEEEASLQVWCCRLGYCVQGRACTDEDLLISEPANRT